MVEISSFVVEDNVGGLSVVLEASCNMAVPVVPRIAGINSAISVCKVNEAFVVVFSITMSDEGFPVVIDLEILGEVVTFVVTESGIQVVVSEVDLEDATVSASVVAVVCVFKAVVVDDTASSESVIEFISSVVEVKTGLLDASAFSSGKMTMDAVIEVSGAVRDAFVTVAVVDGRFAGSDDTEDTMPPHCLVMEAVVFSDSMVNNKACTVIEGVAGVLGMVVTD